jgi:hypothetical protein
MEQLTRDKERKNTVPLIVNVSPEKAPMAADAVSVVLRSKSCISGRAERRGRVVRARCECLIAGSSDKVEPHRGDEH